MTDSNANKQKKKTIELGHQGEPVIGVILRIYRQRERGNERRQRNGVEEVMWSGEKRSKKKISKRLTLADDCDDDVCFFFLLFCFFDSSIYKRIDSLILFQQEISCSYYEGEGLLSTAGCRTVDVTDEWVDCSYVFHLFLFLFISHIPFLPLSCDHYSNFGLLFSACDSEEWTIWRFSFNLDIFTFKTTHHSLSLKNLNPLFSLWYLGSFALYGVINSLLWEIQKVGETRDEGREEESSVGFSTIDKALNFL